MFPDPGEWHSVGAVGENLPAVGSPWHPSCGFRPVGFELLLDCRNTPVDQTDHWQSSKTESLDVKTSLIGGD